MQTLQADYFAAYRSLRLTRAFLPRQCASAGKYLHLRADAASVTGRGRSVSRLDALAPIRPEPSDTLAALKTLTA
jgi:hypothetical protein